MQRSNGPKLENSLKLNSGEFEISCNLITGKGFCILMQTMFLGAIQWPGKPGAGLGGAGLGGAGRQVGRGGAGRGGRWVQVTAVSPVVVLSVCR